MLVKVENVANHSFDYIIIGGGTAGLVIAARLTEDPSTSVCVLEAGPANLDDPVILRTGVYANEIANPLYDWTHMSTTQKALGRQMLFSRGRGLGGSSSINFMGWQRPPADELDDLEKLGSPGWNWKNLLKYMKKCEKFVEPPKEIDDLLNIPYKDWDVGRDGPLLVSFPRTVTKLEEHLQMALIDMGFPSAEEPYGGKTHGAAYSINAYNPYNYSRSYAVPAYYIPNKERHNLNVLVNALVDCVQTEKAASGALNATQVVFTHDGKTHAVKATKEIILCAGAVQSPVILERSGIGRREVLEKVGVPIKVELPGVGENLQEHCASGVAFELKEDVPYPTLDISRDPALLPEQLELYKEGKGTLCMGLMNFGFLAVEDISSKAEDIYQEAKTHIDQLEKDLILPGLMDQFQIQLARLRPGHGPSGPGCEFIMSPGMVVTPAPTPPGKKYISIVPVVNHTFSRGNIHIVARDPTVEPEIDPCYFENPADLSIFVEMIKTSRKIAQVPRLQALINHESFPGPSVQTDEEIAAFLKAGFSTVWHTVGTCSMLPREKGGVVDNRLKVYGTENLRVVDMSIIPLHFAAHPQCVLYGVAEMASEIIKGKFEAL